MQTLQERLAAASQAAGQQTLVQQPPQQLQQQPQANPFAGQPQQPAPQGNPFGANPAAFGAPAGQQQHLTEAPPPLQPFNPGGNPFQPGASGQVQYTAAPAAQQQANPFGGQPQQPTPQQPQVQPTPFAASSMPLQQTQQFPGFGTPPQGQQVANPFGIPPNTNTGPLPGNPPTFPGVNSPEASTAITANEAAAQPQGKRKRRTKAEMAAASGQTQQVTAVGVDGQTYTMAVPGGAQPSVDDEGFEVTITIRDLTSGSVVTIPAPDQIADQMVSVLGGVLEGLR